MSDNEERVDELDTLDDGLPPLLEYHVKRLEYQQIHQDALKPFVVNCFMITKEIAKVCGLEIKHLIDFKYVKWNTFVTKCEDIREILEKHTDVLKTLFEVNLEYKSKCIENRNVAYMKKMLKRVGYKIIKTDIFMSIKKG